MHAHIQGELGNKYILYEKINSLPEKSFEHIIYGPDF